MRLFLFFGIFIRKKKGGVFIKKALQILNCNAFRFIIFFMGKNVSLNSSEKEFLVIYFSCMFCLFVCFRAAKLIKTKLKLFLKVGIQFFRDQFCSNRVFRIPKDSLQKSLFFGVLHISLPKYDSFRGGLKSQNPCWLLQVH